LNTNTNCENLNYKLLLFSKRSKWGTTDFGKCCRVIPCQK